MLARGAAPRDDTILIFAPTGRDPELLAQMLARLQLITRAGMSPSTRIAIALTKTTPRVIAPAGSGSAAPSARGFMNITRTTFR